MRPKPIVITEKLLSAAGGWQAMKAARESLKAGRVLVANYEAPLLQGEVREGQKIYRAGLRIRSASDVENICTCRESRDWGQICAHSLAVGLAYLAPVAAPQPTLPDDAPARTALPLVSRGEQGATPVALRFILPPNFNAAWGKGEIMVCVEAEFDGRRVMLDALPSKQRFGSGESDLAVVEHLSSSLGRAASGMNILGASAFLELLPMLRGHPKLSFGKGKAFRVLSEMHRPEIILRPAGKGFEAVAQAGGVEMFLVAGTHAWVLRGTDFLEIGSHLPLRLTNALCEPVGIKSERVDEFFALELPRWREFAEIELPAGVLFPSVEKGEPAFSLRLEGSLQRLRAVLRCSYGDRPPLLAASQPENSFVFRNGTDEHRLLVRNLAAENEAVAHLERAGFVPTDESYEMHDARRVVRFFAFDFPTLPSGWEISVAPHLEKARAELEPVVPTIEIVRSGEDWFELKYSVAAGAGEGISLAEVKRLLRSGQNQTRLPNGKIAVLNSDALDDFEEVLRDADPRQAQPGIYRLDKIQAGYLANTVEEIGARLIGAAQTLHGIGKATDVAERLGPIGQRLRDYQLHGVSWLSALAEQNLGGILADEMGLGKTVQALSFLHLYRGHGPALIVCPTSLLANWQREAERFTPDLKVLLIDGTNRPEKIASLSEYDIALTSYGLLRRDVELYAGRSLTAVVLDEAQHIKNPDTQNAQAAFRLSARRRFVLTGTPMENSVRDLWSLMNFVAPGYLGARNDFRQRYEKPLTTNHRPSSCNVGWPVACARSCSVAASPMSRGSCRKKSNRCSPANLARDSAKLTTRSCARFSRG